LGIEYLGHQNDVLSRCGHMKLFSKGHSRRMNNAICGETGNEKITLGDYRYTTGHTKNRRHHSQTVCVLQSDRLNVPHCFLRPEVAFFDSIGSLLGGQDIDFADDPAFSGAYVLQGDSEVVVREFFDADIRAWFAERRGRGFHVEFRGDTLVFHTGKSREPDEAKQLMQQALEILNVLAKG
ncbi:MAG: hypothetical protein V3R99_10530, partial [Thermoguttaceae bacterium]